MDRVRLACAYLRRLPRGCREDAGLTLAHVVRTSHGARLPGSSIGEVQVEADVAVEAMPCHKHAVVDAVAAGTPCCWSGASRNAWVDGH